MAAAVFGLGAALPRAVTLLLLPLYTHALSPAEYGRLSVLLTLGVALSFVVPMGLDLAVFRNFFRFGESEEATRADYVRTVWAFQAITALPLTAFLGAVLWVVLERVIAAPFREYVVMLIAFGLGSVALPVPLAVLRAGHALSRFAVFSVASAAFTAIGTVVAVVILDLGVMGWLAATAIANGLLVAMSLPLASLKPPSVWDSAGLRDAVNLGRTIVPHYITHWGLQSANRFVVAFSMGAAAVGVLSLGANLAVPALIVGQALNQSLAPRYARAGHDRGERSALGRVVLAQSLLSVSACAAWLLVAEPLVLIVSPAEFHDAANLVGWLCLGYLFLGLYYPAMNYVSLVAGERRWTWLLPVVALAIAFGLMQWNARSGDLGGVAVATCIGFALLAFGAWGAALLIARVRPEVAVDLPWAGVGLSTLIVGGFVLGGLSITTSDAWRELLLRLLYVIAILGIGALGWFVRRRRMPALRPR